MEVIESNWIEILLALMTFLKVVFNYIPSAKAVRIFGFLDDFINYVVKDKRKDV